MATNKELEKKVNELSTSVSQLTALITSVVDRLPKVEKKLEPVTLEQKLERMLGGASDPIPTDYRAAVDDLLNKDFGVHVKGLSNVPSFKFTILVPKKYSREPEFDPRVRVITYAEGTLGVKTWCELVLKTFDDETRQRIISDRTVINIML